MPISLGGSGMLFMVPAEPDAVVDALKSLLGANADVSLTQLGDEPFAVVKRMGAAECWVNLAASIGAFPSASPEDVARAIAAFEKWT